MRQKLSFVGLFSLLFFLGSFSTKAQTVYDISGPAPFSSSNFSFTGGATTTAGFTNWHQYNTGGTGNTWSTPYTMPFVFEFFGDTVTHFIVSKNYLLSFDTTRADSSVNALINDNSALPNPNLPDNTIAGFWDNYANGTGTLGTNDNIWIGEFGVAPNRQLFIKFFSLETGGRSFSYGHWMLEESTNNIYFIDTYMGGTTGSMTIGVQKDSVNAFQVAGSPNILPIVTSTAWTALEYYTFDPRQLVPNDAGVSSIDNPSAPFTTGSQMVNATIRNFGTSALTTATVNWSVNGVAQTPFSFTGNLATDSTTSIALGMFNFTGISTIDVWTSNPNGVADNFTPNDTASITLFPSLSGAYTVDSSSATGGTNFQSFTDLANSISLGGVSGPVTVSVAAGTYNDQFSVGVINGSSATNTIEIDGGGAATLTHDKSIRNSTVTLEGSSYLTLKNMTIAATGGLDSWGIQLLDSAHHITIDSNIISMPVGTTTDVAGIIGSDSETSDATAGDNAFDITISNNTISGGERGISMYGSFTASARNQNIIVDNNTFNNVNTVGIYLVGYNNVTISNNTATVLATTGDACYVSDLENFDISGNYFNGPDLGFDADDLNFDNPATGRSTIVNNMFIGGDDAFYLDDVEDIDIFHNSTYAEDYGVYINDPANLDIRNNIFVSNSDYAFYCLDNVPFTGLDYNIYNSNGTNLANFGGIIYADLAAFIVGQPTFNANSIEGDPLYVNNLTDLHSAGVLANDIGDNTVGVLIDFDGETRPFTGSTRVDIGADEFAPPACAPPSSLVSDSITSNSVFLTWLENGTATEWEVEWDTAGFTAGSGTNSIIVVTDTFLAVTGLNPATAYDWNVRAICGIADTSSWTAGTFTTTIQGPQGFTCITGNTSALFSDDLEATAGWTGDIGTGATLNNWNYRTGGTGSSGTGPLAAHSGTQYVYVETSGATVTPVSFVSPIIDLSAGNDFAELSFWLHAFGNQIGTLDVGVGTSATGPFTNEFSVTGAQQATQASPWINVGVNLDAYVGQTIYLEFLYTTNGSFEGDIALDLIEVSTCVSCAIPSNLRDTLASLSGVTIDWDENGTATNWEISYGPSTTAPGGGTQVVTTTKPYVITGLPSGTAYDFYVRSICGPGDTSAWSSLGNFHTLIGIPWSDDLETFTNGRANQNGWSNVNSADPDWTADNGGTGSGGTGPDVDHTLGTAAGIYVYLETSGGAVGARDTLSSPAMLAGATQDTLVVDYWYHMAGATMGQMQVWVESAGVWDSITTYVGPQQALTSDPWLSASHVIGGYSGQDVTIHFIGERGTSFTGDMAVDDISVTEFFPNNIGITDIIRPNSGCGLTAADSVEVEITNFGGAAQSNFDVGFSVNGVAITPETVTSTLGVGMSMNYTFATTANLSTTGNNSIVAYTLLTADSDNTNDSTSKDVFNNPIVSSFPYSESFESGAANWRATGSTTFELGAPNNTIIDTASNGTQAWVTDLDGNYLVNESGAVNSPCFDFTGINNPTIELDIWWDAENSFDGAVLQSSIDGGATWQKVGADGDTVNWYNDNSILGLSSVEPSQEGWTGSPGSLGWITARRALDSLGGESSVQLRIAFGSDGSVVDEGFAFDNVRIYDNVPYSPIAAINTVDTNGVANSLGESVKTSGSVIGVDIRGGNGIQFTMVEQTMSGHEGIHVFSGGGTSGYVVNEGDSIEISGTISQFNGLTQINPDSIRIIKTNAFIPTPISTSVLNESTESKWLSLSTDFVLLDPSGTGSYNMDATNGTDTITIRVDSDTDVNDSLNAAGQNLVVGDTICGMLGIGGQFDSSNPFTDGYQIFPMRYSDITICRLSVGINENTNEKTSFAISPNPTEGQFTITTSKLSSDNAQLIIRDLSGKVIFEERIVNSNSTFTKTFDLSGNAKGVYFISIIDGDQLINQKLIKQ